MNYKYNAEVTVAQIQSDVARENKPAATAEKTIEVTHDAEGKVQSMKIKHKALTEGAHGA